jgi:glycerophosphoryl diester phosphodiesterase
VTFQINNGVIGHRGASAYAPENTLVAFELARSLGCQVIEFDVMLSVDGEPFVIHDESLKRTTDGKGEVGLVEAGYLHSLDAGKWFSKRFRGEKIPHFQEAIKWLSLSDVNANIEIKPYPGTTEKTTIAVLTCLQRYWPQDKPMPLVSSFDEQALVLCRSIAPELPLGLLLDAWDKDWLTKAENLQCTSININKKALNAARVQEIKSKGFQVLVYTVNRKGLAKKLLGWGVDAVFSDYPDLLS